MNDHRRLEFVTQRPVARMLGLAGALLAFAMMLMVGCMLSWIGAAGQTTSVTNWLLAGVGSLSLAGGICAMVARMWAR